MLFRRQRWRMYELRSERHLESRQSVLFKTCITCARATESPTTRYEEMQSAILKISRQCASCAVSPRSGFSSQLMSNNHVSMHEFLSRQALGMSIVYDPPVVDEIKPLTTLMRAHALIVTQPDSLTYDQLRWQIPSYDAA